MTIGFAINAFNFIKTYNKSPFGAIFIITFLSLGSFYLWYKILDNGVKRVINKDGIWTKKYGLVKWENIFNYQFEKRKGKTVTYNLKIDTQNPGRLIVCEITYLDTEFSEVKKAIDINSKEYNIQYLGIDEYEY